MSFMVSQERDLPYRLEMWDDDDSQVAELIALVADHVVARVAFAEAVRWRKVVILARSRECWRTAEGEAHPARASRHSTAATQRGNPNVCSYSDIGPSEVQY